jgi:hypothetical protein
MNATPTVILEVPIKGDDNIVDAFDEYINKLSATGSPLRVALKTAQLEGLQKIDAGLAGDRAFLAKFLDSLAGGFKLPFKLKRIQVMPKTNAADKAAKAQAIADLAADIAKAKPAKEEEKEEPAKKKEEKTTKAEEKSTSKEKPKEEPKTEEKEE